jgi:hypothetical protein
MRLFGPGDRVNQAQYGHGTVTKIDEYHTCVDFDDHGLRTFSTPRSHFEPSATAAPVKPTRAKRATKASKAKAAKLDTVSA